MLKVSVLIQMSLLLVVCVAYGSEQSKSNRYANQHRLSTGETAVVAEGDFEPRSIGSYSVRIYGVNPNFPTDNFIYGTISPRNGIIEKVITQDINGDGIEEIIVIIRSVGTGGYLSADAYQYRSNRLELIANVTDLEKNEDPIQQIYMILETKTK